jgi:FemAB-related protein (PEP-CTERM system-associated)
MNVTELDQDDAAWQEYVRRSPRASFYHALEWRDVIIRTFAHRSRYLIAREGSDVRGVLPLIEMDSALFGHFFVSLPFFNYGGTLADTPAAERALADAAIALAQKRGASHIELRQSFPSAEALEGWTLRQHKAALVIPLAGDPKPHWDGLSSRLRGKIRKAEKNGAEFTVGGKERLADFYHLYALNMRELGTPVYSRSFFDNILEHGGQNAQVLLVQRDGKPAAAAIALREGGRIEMPWICQDYAASAINANEFLYWKSIEWACQEGASELDLGRSSIDAGTYKFKLQWNPESRGLYWYYWTAPGVPAPHLTPDNPKYALAVKCWQKLPLSVTNFIGPWIVRNIP